MMVDILVAKYNDKKYVVAQLLSLLFKSHRENPILLRNGVNTDATRDIDRCVSNRDKRVLFIEDGMPLESADGNFTCLLKCSGAKVAIFGVAA